MKRQSKRYYAYGLPHGDAYYPEKNRRKFGGKEYMTEFGLDEYDYGARRHDPLLGHFSTPDPFAIMNPSISPWAFCNGDPINFIDPTGEMVIYNKSGEYMGHSSEGFTGDVYIYRGQNKIDFSKYSESEILKKFDVTPFDSMRGGCIDSERLSGEAMSKIWTHIVSQFEGTTIYDEKFSMNRIPKGVISYEDINYQKDDSEKGGWKTWLDENLKPSHIVGTGSYLYETTVENVSSSVIVHEWYSHQIKGVNDDLKSHRLAYKNVINYKALWNNTTNAYKAFVLEQLRSYTYGETGRMNVDPPYRNLYNKYVK